MSNESFLQTTQKDPIAEPQIPDDPHPTEPEGTRDPPREPNPYPVSDPPIDPAVEPAYDPEPLPSFPEPIPGDPPNVIF